MVQIYIYFVIYNHFIAYSYKQFAKKMNGDRTIGVRGVSKQLFQSCLRRREKGEGRIENGEWREFQSVLQVREFTVSLFLWIGRFRLKKAF